MSADRFFEYALGLLDPAEAAALEAELAASPELRRILDETRAALELVPLDLAPVAPSPALKARLLRSIEDDRYAPFSAKLSRLFDLGQEAMRAVLERARRATEWEPGPFPGSALFHFQGGPAVASADCGLVELAPGFEHPYHEHEGFERSLILEGSITDDDGTVYRAGDLVLKEPGTGHAYVVGPSRYVVALALGGPLYVYPEGKGGPVVRVSGPKHD